MNSIHGIHIPLALPICLVSFEIVDGPALTWWVRRFEIEEHWSELYRIELDLIADDPTLGLDQLIGADCELTLDRQSTIRTLCGVIRRASFSGTDQNQVHVRLEVVPGLALLDQGCNTRVWQHMSLAQIIERVLTPGLAAHGRELDSSMLSTTYPEREYVIQTRESDHAFARRLMAEAGIGYTFDHERGTGREVVVLVDSHDHTLDIPTIDGDSTLRVIADRPDQAEVESLQSMTWSRELALTRITRAHYDWQAPEVPVIVSCGAVDERHRVREHYDHDQAFEPDSDYEACPGAELNTARHRAEILRATSNVIGLAPGRRFSIVDHEFETARGDYVVTRIRHLGEDPRVALGPSANAEPSYTNEFECLRFVGDRPLRPTPRSKPRIAGVHTAIVTGPAGEEIHTDEHGRIKVRFYWERERTLDDDSSLWVRVAQAWAGAGFGMLFIPRVGMEVVVEFIEGDPDRPLVTGCVYNGSALPSLALPESNTQSTMRTRSSPGGAGYNELRFEDAAGSEQVFVHAQRDLIEQIEHEHRTSVARPNADGSEPST